MANTIVFDIDENIKCFMDFTFMNDIYKFESRQTKELGCGNFKELIYRLYNRECAEHEVYALIENIISSDRTKTFDTDEGVFAEKEDALDSATNYLHTHGKQNYCDSLIKFFDNITRRAWHKKD